MVALLLLEDLPKGLGARRLGRIVALSVLYELDSSTHSWGDALEHALEELRLTRDSRAFATELVQGVVQKRPELDKQLQHFAPERPLAQLSPIDRNILRIAIYEILINNKTPPKAVIDEAVELSKSYGSENLHRFVNGVLGSVLEAAQHPEN